MINLNNEDLLQHLKGQKFDVKMQEATNQLYVIFKIEGREFPMFIKTDGTVLQLMIFMPCILQPQAIPDMARLLHFFNKEIDLPGFGMDEGPGVVFFRCTLPTVNGKIDPDLLDNLFISMPRLAQTFFPSVSSVASGATTFEKASKRMREAINKQVNGKQQK